MEQHVSSPSSKSLALPNVGDTSTSSIQSWPLAKISKGADASRDDGVDLSSGNFHIQQHLNKSLESALSIKTKSSLVLNMAAKMEVVKRAPEPLNKVSELVASFDSKKSVSPNNNIKTTRSVLENSPWKEHGIENSHNSSSSKKKKSLSGSAPMTTQKVNLAPVQQRLFQSAINTFSERNMTVTQRPSPVTSHLDANQDVAFATTGSPASLKQSSESLEVAVATSPLPTPSPLQRATRSKIMDKISLFEQGRNTSNDSSIVNRVLTFDKAEGSESNGASMQSATQTDIISYVVRQEKVVDGDRVAKKQAQTGSKDPPAKSPIKQEGEYPPALSPLKVDEPAADKEETTLTLDYSATPSKLLAESELLASPSIAANGVISRLVKDSVAATKMNLGALEKSFEPEAPLETSQSPSRGTPRRVPLVTLFPRAGGAVFDLPTTPSRPDNSMDISSLQASPIGQADESFMTLEESWRAPALRTNVMQECEGDGLRVYDKSSPLPQETQLPTQPMVHFSEKCEMTPTHAFQEPVITMTDEFAAKETPRTNNQSFTSHDSSSYKESFQSKRPPPAIPKRFSTANCLQRGAFVATDSSSRPRGEVASSNTYQAEVSSIVAALERVIPFNRNTKQVCIHGSSGHTQTDTDISGTVEYTRSSYDTYDDEEDIFEGLELEADKDELEQTNNLQATTGLEHSKTSALRPPHTHAQSQALRAPVTKSKRSFAQKKLRLTVPTAAQNIGLSTKQKIQLQQQREQQTKEKLSSRGKKQLSIGHPTFQVSSPVKSDNLFQHIAPDEYTSSDDSSYSSDTYTIHTLEIPQADVKEANGLVKSFFSFLSFGEDDSGNKEAVSPSSPPVENLPTVSPEPAKKLEYSAATLETDTESGPSFASIAFKDLLKLMNCNVGSDELLRTTEKHLSGEFGTSTHLEQNEPLEDRDPEVETLIYDVAFFDSLWNEITSRQTTPPSWTVSLCGSIDNVDSVAGGTEDLSPDEQKIFNAVFPSSKASPKARRKAAQVLSVCRQRFPSMYQSLVTQLEAKARRTKTNRKATPTQPVPSPITVLPPVKEEVLDAKNNDAAADYISNTGFAFSQTVLSSLQETAMTFMSAPTSTFTSDFSGEDDRISLEFSAFDEAIVDEVTSVQAPVQDEMEGSHVAKTSCMEIDMDDGEFANEKRFSTNEIVSGYLESSNEERLVLNYSSAEKECKEDDDIVPLSVLEEDDSTYILHYIEGSSKDCYVMESSRDAPTDDDLLSTYATNEGSFKLVDNELSVEPSGAWESFTPPRKQSASITAVELHTDALLSRSVSAPPGKPNESWEHFTTKNDIQYINTGVSLLATDKGTSKETTTYTDSRTEARSASAPKHRADSINEVVWLHKTPIRRGRATLSTDNQPVTPKAENITFGKLEDTEPQWEAFSASFFETAKQQELVATVKRDNTKKQSAPKLKSSKFDESLSYSRSQLEHPSVPLLDKHGRKECTGRSSKQTSSPTSVGPPKNRRLRVADLYSSKSKLF
ncbi:hypothetical protein MPSEU_000142700 [Mayamaea pseudoterrestris]|nr:hypothetical protein MPSEU_000142700 [Mayamaea pseudoterrestris]